MYISIFLTLVAVDYGTSAAKVAICKSPQGGAITFEAGKFKESIDGYNNNDFIYSFDPKNPKEVTIKFSANNNASKMYKQAVPDNSSKGVVIAFDPEKEAITAVESGPNGGYLHTVNFSAGVAFISRQGTQMNEKMESVPRLSYFKAKCEVR
jgi:hypothetical protein